MIYNGLDLHGISEVIPCEDGVRMRRVPKETYDGLNPKAQEMAERNVGAEIRFVPTGDVKITLSTLNEDEYNTIYVYYGSFQSGWETASYTVTHTPKEFTFRQSSRLSELAVMSEEGRAPFAPVIVRLLLGSAPLVIHKVEGDVRPPRKEELPDMKGLFYGSSITHGSLALLPSLFFSRHTADILGCDSENFGFAGSCHVERTMADYFASRTDWDFMVLEMGINVKGTMPPEEFRDRVHYMLNTIHGAHPDKYLFCLDIFTTYSDYFDENHPSRHRTECFRSIVAEEAAAIRSEYVRHFDARTVLDTRQMLTEDLTHPTTEGVIHIADNLSYYMNPYISRYRAVHGLD